MTVFLVGLAAFVVGRLTGLGLAPFKGKTLKGMVQVFVAGGPGVEE